jgi:hypothetical protein
MAGWVDAVEKGLLRARRGFPARSVARAVTARSRMTDASHTVLAGSRATLREIKAKLGQLLGSEKMRNVINTTLLIFGLALLVVAITPTVNTWLNQHCLLYCDALCKLR